MDNYVGFCRSNSVRVKNRDAMFAFLKSFDNPNILDKDGKVAFYTIESGMPCRSTATGEDETLLDCTDELAKQVADGEVLIVTEIGFEDGHELVGFAIAIYSTGATCTLRLSDIYPMAASAFGVDANSIGRHSP